MTLEAKVFLTIAPTLWDLPWGESKAPGQKSLRVYQAILHCEETKAQKNSFSVDSYTGCLLPSLNSKGTECLIREFSILLCTVFSQFHVSTLSCQ